MDNKVNTALASSQSKQLHWGTPKKEQILVSLSLVMEDGKTLWFLTATRQEAVKSLPTILLEESCPVMCYCAMRGWLSHNHSDTGTHTNEPIAFTGKIPKKKFLKHPIETKSFQCHKIRIIRCSDLISRVLTKYHEKQN